MHMFLNHSVRRGSAPSLSRDMMPKSFKVTEVKVRVEASASKYLKSGRAPDDLKELLKGVRDIKSWSIDGNLKKQEVSSAYPEVDGHPGHVQGRDWKMNIERGNGSVDRLFLSKRRYTVEPNKKDPDVLNVEIYCAAFVEEDTH